MPALAAWRRLRLRVAVPVALAAALAISVGVSVPAEAHRTERERRIHHGVEVAIRQKGDPYRYGADGPGAFDCSGLTKFSYRRAGLYLPRSSDSQYRYMRRIPKRKIRRGDFVFFHTRSGSVYHIGIFLGHHNGHRYVLHAPQTGTVVQRDKIWTHHWFAGTLRRRS